MGHCPKPRQRDAIPLETRHWLYCLACSPPLGGFAYAFSFTIGEDRALPQTPPKGCYPFGIPALVALQLDLLAALGRLCLCYCFVIGDDGALPQTPPKGCYPFGNPVFWFYGKQKRRQHSAVGASLIAKRWITCWTFWRFHRPGFPAAFQCPRHARNERNAPARCSRRFPWKLRRCTG